MASFEEGAAALSSPQHRATGSRSSRERQQKSTQYGAFKHTAPGLKVVWLSAEGYDGRGDT